MLVPPMVARVLGTVSLSIFGFALDALNVAFGSPPSFDASTLTASRSSFRCVPSDVENEDAGEEKLISSSVRPMTVAARTLLGLSNAAMERVHEAGDPHRGEHTATLAGRSEGMSGPP